MTASQKKESTKKDSVKKLHISRFKNSEFARQSWFTTPAQGDSVEDTLKPEYWSHVAASVAINSEIKALWEDGSRYAEYVVLRKGSNWLNVALINEVDLTKKSKKTEKKDEEYEVYFINQHHKFGVRRVSDNKQLKKGIETRDAAEEWLASHRKDAS